jgi:hypothetical protein
MTWMKASIRRLPSRRLNQVAQPIRQFRRVVLAPTPVDQPNFQHIAQVRPVLIAVGRQLYTNKGVKNRCHRITAFREPQIAVAAFTTKVA